MALMAANNIKSTGFLPMKGTVPMVNATEGVVETCFRRKKFTELDREYSELEGFMGDDFEFTMNWALQD